MNFTFFLKSWSADIFSEKNLLPFFSATGMPTCLGKFMNALGRNGGGLIKSKSLKVRLSPWRNRLARSAVNRKVVGSSPTGDAFFLLYLLLFFVFFSCYPWQEDKQVIPKA